MTIQKSIRVSFKEDISFFTFEQSCMTLLMLNFNFIYFKYVSFLLLRNPGYEELPTGIQNRLKLVFPISFGQYEVIQS